MMSLCKVLLVELKEDPESEGLVVDRLFKFDPGLQVWLGVTWLVPPSDNGDREAIEYYPPDALTVIDVLDDVSDLDEEEETEEEEEEEEEQDAND